MFFKLFLVVREFECAVFAVIGAVKRPGEHAGTRDPVVRFNQHLRCRADNPVNRVHPAVRVAGSERVKCWDHAHAPGNIHGDVARQHSFR